MTRRAFVLSWGRKVFFGLGWTITSLIALTYFKSFIVPQTFISWFYFLVTFVGHYGLLITLVYFLFYVPVASLFPTYYVSRFWSLLLLLALNGLIFVDALIYSQYHLHIHGFIADFLARVDMATVLNFSHSDSILLILGGATISLAIWFRGEKIWRQMQSRFSNPNASWYFYLIAACLVLSHGLHIYGDAKGKRKITRIAELFPLHFPATARVTLAKYGIVPDEYDPQVKNDFKDFHYPRHEMKCPGTKNQNILFIVLTHWKKGTVPAHINHLAIHGQNFNQHYSGGQDSRDGLFSLFYSIPGVYWNSALTNQVSPVFMDELQKRGYELGIYSSSSLINPEFDQTIFLKVPQLKISTVGETPEEKDTKITSDWRNFLRTHVETRSDKPFFGFLYYNSLSLESVDSHVKEVVDELYAKGQLKETIIVLTRDHDESLDPVPFILIWPDKDPTVIERRTSHYDVIPTFMQELWDCKNKVEGYSSGKSLFEEKEKGWHVFVGQKDFTILDFEKSVLMTMRPDHKYEVTNLQHQKIDKKSLKGSHVFEAMRFITRFQKSR